MATSNAKKYRNKIAREGRRNPEDNRSPFAFADMRMRRTKTKKDKLYKKKYKNHDSTRGNDGFYFFHEMGSTSDQSFLKIDKHS